MWSNGLDSRMRLMRIVRAGSGRSWMAVMTFPHVSFFETCWLGRSMGENPPSGAVSSSDTCRDRFIRRRWLMASCRATVVSQTVNFPCSGL